ncbi:MAG: flagellar basal body rod protein FlgB [Clostridiales bacterium]|nr:flagellar basal body rod protein FlgB [Clostridiales bacterium]MCF8021725.1 flagellar basal body rod protein FlgB [Clostridiales bacterium]
MFFNSEVNAALIKQLDACNTRQKVTADNIANINTPGFKKSEVQFKDQLNKALNQDQQGLLTTHPRHLPQTSSVSNAQPKVVEVNNTTMTAGDNNVDIDTEMNRLSKNSLHYQVTGQLFSKRKSIMNYIVRGG